MTLPPEPPADAPRNFPPSHLTPPDGAAATIGVDTAQVEAVSDAGARKGRILAWGLWDWGSAAFNAVVTTFVFTVYLTSEIVRARPARSRRSSAGRSPSPGS